MSNIKLSKEDIEQLTKLQNEENRLIVNFGRPDILKMILVFLK